MLIVEVATSELVIPDAYAIAFTVAVADMVNAAEYTVPVVAVGVEPSVVYLIAAPAVPSVIVTVCADVYVPVAGVIEGVTTFAILIVIVEVATSELVIPEAYAIAFTVAEADTVNAAVYTVPVVAVGVEPSVVYLIVAPAVPSVIVTVCADVYVPVAGVIEGVTTFAIGGVV